MGDGREKDKPSSKETEKVATSNTVAVPIVDLFDGAVTEGQFAHPVDAAADAGSQAKAGVGGRCVESVRSEIIITALNEIHWSIHSVGVAECQY